MRLCVPGKGSVHAGGAGTREKGADYRGVGLHGQMTECQYEGMRECRGG